MQMQDLSVLTKRHCFGAQLGILHEMDTVSVACKADYVVYDIGTLLKLN